MNTGQLLLIVGAMALLSTGILMMNNSFTESGKVVMQSKLGITATSLASSIMEQATSHAFDKFTADSNTTSLSDLTAPNSLGLEAGESYPDSLDDVDDFNNMVLTRSYDKGGSFNIHFKVTYVLPTSPDVVQNVRTWHKKLTVSVTSPQMTDTVRSEYIYSYWYFR